jgi:hypothetical protein
VFDYLRAQEEIKWSSPHQLFRQGLVRSTNHIHWLLSIRVNIYPAIGIADLLQQAPERLPTASYVDRLSGSPRWRSIALDTRFDLTT